MTDLLIRNAALWSAGRSVAGDALAVRDGKIVAIGSYEDVRHEVRAATEIDAKAALVTPGFADAHIHLGVATMDTLQCDLAGARSVDECLAAVADFAGSTTRPWVVGGGWDLTLFHNGLPTAALLDRVVPDRPAMLLNADHHGAWVNTLALRAAGIEASTPDPYDGRIERTADGHPSGMLHEGAVQLVARVLPAPDTEDVARGIAQASERILSAGITAWQEAALGEYGGFPDFTAAYRLALGRGILRGRASGAIWAPRDLTVDGVPAFVERCRELREENGLAGFPTRTVKLMLDGIVETRTAALREPYLGEEGGRGLSYFTPAVIQAVIPALNTAGFAVHVHAIGDRAVGDALDGFERVPATARAAVRNHIAHLQIVSSEDVPRFAELAVFANIQPLWACDGPATRQLTLPLLGAERAKRLYVFDSLRRAGAPLAMGSDWPVSDFDPWQGLHVAVTRRSPGDDTGEGLNPDERLPLRDALDAYTRGSSTLLGEHGSGELTMGARADIAIANRNPFDGPADDIHLTRTRVTIVGGEVLHFS